jgi:hypothetical protein
MHETEKLKLWLAAEVGGTPPGATPTTFLAHLNPTERTNLLYGLMRRDPELAATTQRLSLYDQLRLSLELVRRIAPAAAVCVQPRSRTASALSRCFAQAAGAHRRLRRS